MKILKGWKSFNEEFFYFEENVDGNDSENEKDKWWEENYQVLIDYASDLQYEDWKQILDDDTEMVDATMDSTGKHKALTLLQMFPIEELENIKNMKNNNEE